MPAKSEKQRRFMAAVANNPKFANKVGVPQSVGEEFMKKSKNYMGGGMMKRYAEGGKLDMVEKDGKMVPFYAADGKGKMMGGGKVMKYAEGDIIGASPSGSGATRGPRDRAAEIKVGVPSDSLPEDGREVGKIPEKKSPSRRWVVVRSRATTRAVRSAVVVWPEENVDKLITMKGA
jgi:hypothetical protein